MSSGDRDRPVPPPARSDSGSGCPVSHTGFLEAGGRRLEYAWHGPPPDEAPTLVFLHEGLGCVSLWRDFPARLADATGCGALVYSRAGYGRSDPVPLPRPVSFMHDEALRVLPEVLDAAGVREAVLVGHSDGASIALVHAGSGRAERVRALVLEAPHVFVEDVSVASIAAIGRAYRETELRARLARHHGENVDCAFLGWNGVWLDPDFRGWNVEEYLPRVAVPVLVVQGEADEYGTLAQVEAVRRQAGGPVETLVLPGAGHSPHRDAPEAVLEAMAGFVGRAAGGDRETINRDR
ncbi:MAG TPA: alpha/beta hydrolase [Longimicrobiaceae bacterium]|nr:alpha/beta hydrolase [Longimicrobiaceae bacterium]